MEPDVSVVVCTFNRAASLRVALDTVIAQDTAGLETELVVVDDGSTDSTQQVIAEIRERANIAVRSILQQEKTGIAAARNAGLSESRGRYIIFFDDDQLADPGWIVGLHRVATSKDAEIVGGGRRLDLDSEQLARLGPVCRGLLGENLYDRAPEVLRGKELPTTGNLLLARSLVDRIGRFDTTLLSSGEDAELIGRARNAGVQVWTAPEAMVAHMVPAYRTTAAYFRWVSLRWGLQFATIDAKRHGRLRAVLNAELRLAQALLMHLPRLVQATLTGDAARAMDLRCLLWRAQGYVRKTLQLLLPRAFGQRRFFEELSFRNERQLFGEPLTNGRGA